MSDIKFMKRAPRWAPEFTRYQRKHPIVVSAVEIPDYKKGQVPEGLGDGQYDSTNCIYTSDRGWAYTFETDNTNAAVKLKLIPGSFLVEYANGKRAVVEAKEFLAEYAEIVPEGEPKGSKKGA